jgi:hypothetical protein
MTTFSLTGFESDGRKYFCKSVVFGNPQTDLIHEQFLEDRHSCGHLIRLLAHLLNATYLYPENEAQDKFSTIKSKLL